MMPENYDWEAAWQKPERPANVLPHPTITNYAGSAYGVKGLKAEIEILSQTGEGSRNHQLNVSAYNLGQLVGGGHLDANSTIHHLRTTALAIGLTQSETEATIKSGFNDGLKNPRIVPEMAPNNIIEIQTIDPKTGQTMQPAPEQQTAIDRRYLELGRQVLKTDQLRQLKPPTYLIDKWLIQDSLAWISGKPGDGKSFIALDMACAVGTGLTWQGNSTVQGVVLYLAAEGAAGLAIRLDAWMTVNNHPDESNLNFLPVPVKMIDTDHVDTQALIQLLQDLKPTLIIIDTQARVTTGLEENSSKDMGRFVDALEALRATCPATYLVVHHTPRNGENLRGSTALEGAAETIVRAVKNGDLVTLECQKQKNAAPPDDLEMALQPIGDSVVLSFEASGAIDHTTPSQDELLKRLRSSFGTDEDLTHAKMMKVSTVKSTAYYEAIKGLVSRGKLLKRKEGKGTLYQLLEDGNSGSSGTTPDASPGAPDNNSATPATPLGAEVDGVTAEIDPYSTFGICRICLEPFDGAGADEKCADQHHPPEDN